MSDAASTDSTAPAALLSHADGTGAGLDLSQFKGPLTFVQAGAKVTYEHVQVEAGATNVQAGATINNNEGATINHNGGGSGGEPLATKADVSKILQQLAQIPQQCAAAVIEKIGDKIKQIVTEIVSQLHLRN